MSGYFSKSVKNAGVAAIVNVITLLMSFITRSYFIKYLSTEYLGVSGLFANILTILSFTELGIGNVMVYSLYKPLKKNDKEKLKALLNLYKKAYHYIALIIFVIGIIIMPFVEHLIKGKPDIPEDIRFLFFLYLMNTVASYLCTYKKSVLLADQKSYLINFVTSVSQILLISMQIAVLAIFRSFTGYLLCQILFTFLVNVILTIIVDHQYEYLNKKGNISLSQKDKGEIFRNVKALAVSKVSGIVSSGTDNIIISKMFGLSPVGLVSNYTMIINSVNNVFYNALTSMVSSIGNFNVDSDRETKQRIFDELFVMVYFVYSFICVCLIVLVNPFIVQWIGEDYLVSFMTVLQLVMGIYVGGVNYAVYSFRTTMGYFSEVQYVYVACAVLNVVLSIIMGYFWGVAGVFAATWISKLVLTEVADSYYTYYVILGRRHYKYFIKYFLFLLIMIINAMICYFIVSLIPFQGWIGLFIKGIVCCASNLFVNIVVFSHRWEFKSIKQRCIVLLRGKLWRK